MAFSISTPLNWLLARIEEPSTWAGTGIVAVGVHSLAPNALGDAILTLGAAVGGVLAVAVPEKTS